MLHHLDEAEHCANDAEGGRITAGAFEYLGLGFAALLLEVQLQIHHAPQVLQVRAVHRQRERLLQKRIGDLVDLCLERDNTVFPGSGSVAEDFLHHVAAGDRAVPENQWQFFDGGEQK